MGHRSIEATLISTIGAHRARGGSIRAANQPAEHASGALKKCETIMGSMHVRGLPLDELMAEIDLNYWVSLMQLTQLEINNFRGLSN
jgi:hypothetical protein